MKKFKVEISKSETKGVEVEIEADSRDHARDIGLEMARTYDFSKVKPEDIEIGTYIVSEEEL